MGNYNFSDKRTDCFLNDEIKRNDRFVYDEIKRTDRFVNDEIKLNDRLRIKQYLLTIFTLVSFFCFEH